MNWRLGFLALGFLAGTGAYLASAQADWSIGVSKAHILSCAGPPDHVVRVGELEYLYYRGSLAAEVLPTGMAAMVRDEKCETVVVLRNDRSVGFDWRRSPDILRGQLCAPRVNRCLRK